MGQPESPLTQCSRLNASGPKRRSGIRIPPYSELTQHYGPVRYSYESAWRTVNTGSNPVGATSNKSKRKRRFTALLSSLLLGDRPPAKSLFRPSFDPSRGNMRGNKFQPQHQGPAWRSTAGNSWELDEPAVQRSAQSPPGQLAVAVSRFYFTDPRGSRKGSLSLRPSLLQPRERPQVGQRSFRHPHRAAIAD